MKKLFKMLLVAMMVLGLAACGGGGEEAPEGGETKSDKLVIYSPNSDNL